MTLKTRNQWLREKRVIKINERGDHYLVSPDRTARLPLFREDQTTPYAEDWDVMTKRDADEIRREQLHGPRLAPEVHPEDGPEI